MSRVWKPISQRLESKLAHHTSCAQINLKSTEGRGKNCDGSFGHRGQGGGQPSAAVWRQMQCMEAPAGGGLPSAMAAVRAGVQVCGGWGLESGPWVAPEVAKRGEVFGRGSSGGAAPLEQVGQHGGGHGGGDRPPQAPTAQRLVRFQRFLRPLRKNVCKPFFLFISTPLSAWLRGHPEGLWR